MFEIWETIPGWESLYEVSDKGRVRSVDRLVCVRNGGMRRVKSRVLKQRLHGFGYPMVTLSDGPRKGHFTVHNLVAKTFIGPRPENFHVAHGDGNVANAEVENLRYATPGENNQDKILHGTQPSGEEVYCATRSAEDVVRMRELRSSGMKLHEIAEQFDTTDLVVWQITTGVKWKNAGGPITPSKRARKLTDEQLSLARSLRAAGETLDAIANRFGVSRNQIHQKTKDLQLV